MEKTELVPVPCQNNQCKTSMIWLWLISQPISFQPSDVSTSVPDPFFFFFLTVFSIPIAFSKDHLPVKLGYELPLRALLKQWGHLRRHRYFTARSPHSSIPQRGPRSILLFSQAVTRSFLFQFIYLIYSFSLFIYFSRQGHTVQNPSASASVLRLQVYATMLAY